MKGLYAGQARRATAGPTAVAMLEAISREEITLIYSRIRLRGNCSRSIIVSWRALV